MVHGSVGCLRGLFARLTPYSSGLARPGPVQQARPNFVCCKGLQLQNCVGSTSITRSCGIDGIWTEVLEVQLQSDIRP